MNFLRSVRIIVIVFFLLLVFSEGSEYRVFAQQNSEKYFSSVEVDLLPEFDQPSILVVTTYELSQDTALPADITIHIPTAAGRPTMVSAGTTVDGLYEVPYKVKPSGAWTYILIRSSLPIIRVEYYDPTFSTEKINRHYEYKWQSDYPVDNFYVQIQQPYGVLNLQIQSIFDNGEWTSDGVLRYYNIQIGKVEPSKEISFTLDYKKDGRQTSTSLLQVHSSIPVTTNTPGRVTWWNSVPWFLILAFSLILFTVGIFWFSQMNLQHSIINSILVHQKHEKRKTSNGKPEEKQSGEAHLFTEVHCDLCGKRASMGDQFCRSCGNRLREIY